MKRLFFARIPVFKKGYVWRKGQDGHLYLTQNLLGEPGPTADWPGEEEDTYHREPGYEAGPMFWPQHADDLPPEHFRYYDPLQADALFMVFSDLADQLDAPSAATDPNEEELVAMLDFCNNFGVYSVTRHYAVGNQILGIRDLTPQRLRAHTHELRAMVNTWEEARRGDAAAAANLRDGLARSQLTSGVATYHSSNRNPFELRFQVQDLLHAMWFQFALAVDEGTKYRRCEVCNKPFEVSPEANRSDRRTCSNACRFKAYRNRIKKAREMRADGRTLRKIAKELGSDMKTIKGWVGEK